MYLPNYKVSRAVPCLRRLFAGLSNRRPNFDPIWDLWWTKWHWGRFFLPSILSFSCQYHYTNAPCSYFILISDALVWHDTS